VTGPDGAASAGGWSDRIKGVAEVVAPLTLLTALLSYFGYVSSYSHFAYFGIDLSTLGMSTQDLVLRSVAALYIPLLVLLAAALVAYLLHGAVRDVLASGARRRLAFWAGMFTGIVGLLLLVRAGYGIALPVVAETEFPATTPLCLGLGALWGGYGAHVALLARGRAGGPPGAAAARAIRAVTVAIGGVVVLSLFWATNSFASAYGRGQAAVDSTRLVERPSIVLDTKERLYLRFPGVDETALPVADGQEFRFRYRGFRLLIEANGKLFLIPERWRDGGGVLAVPHDDSSRAQFEPGTRERG
jgi:hypothetical protein